MRIIPVISAILILFVGCNSKKHVYVKKNSEEVFLEFQRDVSKAKREYKKNVYMVKGVVTYIGIPKDNPPRKNITYIELENKINPKSCIVIYFDRWINQGVKIGEEIEICCIFSKYRRGVYDEMIIFHEF